LHVRDLECAVMSRRWAGGEKEGSWTACASWPSRFL